MCAERNNLLEIYGIIEKPEFMIVMQYGNRGNLLAYLYQNINELTWKMKLQFLNTIAYNLDNIHDKQLIHCNLHGGNIIFNHDIQTRTVTPFISDFGLSKLVYSS